MPHKLNQYINSEKKKEGKKIIQKTSYTTMKSMKDGNKIKAKLIFIENLSHTILEVQEKE